MIVFLPRSKHNKNAAVAIPGAGYLHTFAGDKRSHTKMGPRFTSFLRLALYSYYLAPDPRVGDAKHKEFSVSETPAINKPICNLNFTYL